MKIRKASGAAASAGATGALDITKLAGNILSPITDLIGNITGAIAGVSITKSNNDSGDVRNYWESRKEIKRDSNIGFYILMGLLIICATLILVIKSKKSK